MSTPNPNQLETFKNLVEALSVDRKVWLNKCPEFAHKMSLGLYDQVNALLLKEGFDFPTNEQNP